MSNIWFRLMAAEFKVRDYLHPRTEIVKEVGLKPGFQVLDYGCRPGGYILPVAEIIGPSGRLYALDALPIAIKMVNKIVAENNLKNVETILSNCDTGLPDEKLDVILLYDVFHDIEDQETVLNELYRVLKQNGVISFSDHHLKDDEMVSKLTATGLFNFEKRNANTYTFIKK
jgi:ubiquinone/menaquinone biosynthesis C-methylase UbiE